MTVTGVELNLAPETFKLQHLLDADMLAKAEEIDEICSSAVKEEAVEKKLTTITSRWSSTVFTFAEYKSRGPVVLQVRIVQLMNVASPDCARAYSSVVAPHKKVI